MRTVVTMDRHMGPEEIEQYSLGDLPEEASVQFDEHLLVCDQCRALVEESDTYVAAMRAAARQIRGRTAKAYPGKAPVGKANSAAGRHRHAL